MSSAPEPAVARLLDFAAALCDVRYAMLHLGDAPAIANDHVPAEAQSVAATPIAGGTLTLFDTRARALTDTQRKHLANIAAQIEHELALVDAVQAARAERDRLNAFVDAAPIAVFHYGIKSGRFSYVNAKFAETVGYSTRELLELDSVTQLIAEDHREAVAEILRRREAGNDEPARYLANVRCRDGRLIHAEIHALVTEAENEGRIVLGAAVDMTSHVAAHRRVRECGEYFRALTNHLPDLVTIVDEDGVLTYVNPASETLLGRAAGELVATTLQELVHPDDRTALAASLAHLEDTRSVLLEARFRHRTGRWRTMEVTASNLLDDPQIRGIVLHLHDVTDRRRMEQELAQRDRLSSLGRLAAQMAHEFNNVLMGIQPVVEIIRHHAGKDAQVRHWTDLLDATVRRGAGITSDILRFARPPQPSLRRVDVGQLLAEAKAAIEPLLGKRMTLRIAPPAERLAISADAAQLVQVLVNLALNARDAMDRNGTLSIDATRENGDVRFTIRDSGSGMSLETLDHLFEPLYSTKSRGTGLGLSVVLQLVTAHHGRVSVESEPGKGTTFHIDIPVLEP